MNVFTVDVEDWFHFDFGGFLAPIESWSEKESRVERVTEDLLDLLSRRQASATFFVLGWVAERCPAMVRKIAEAGHEIGCHTYLHLRVNQAGPERFREDLRKAKTVLEELSGKQVFSFRAPFFSIDNDSRWAFDILAEEDFLYDSSIFPAARLDGGLPGASVLPHRIQTPSGDLLELPISTVQLLGKRVAMFGGGYFRLLPVSLVSTVVSMLNRKGTCVNIYVHPHDLDVGQPRINMDKLSRFRRYVGVSRTAEKLDYLLSKHSFCSVEQFFSLNGGNL